MTLEISAAPVLEISILSNGVLELYPLITQTEFDDDTSFEINVSNPTFEIETRSSYLEISRSTFEIAQSATVYLPATAAEEAPPTRGALDSVNRNLWYVGWYDQNLDMYRIGRRDCSDLESGILYANGTTDFVLSWDDRETYSY